MKEQLITFETAKLAKEKGFDYFQVMFYHENAGGKSLNETSGATHINFREHKKSYHAPTQSLLQKWVNKNYKFQLHCIPNETDDEGWHYVLYDYITARPQNYHHKNTVSDYYNSYEEALEAGLQEALKLI